MNINPYSEETSSNDLRQHLFPESIFRSEEKEEEKKLDCTIYETTPQIREEAKSNYNLNEMYRKFCEQWQKGIVHISRLCQNPLESEEEKLDCTIYETALQVLGLSKEEAEDSDILEKRYRELCAQWEKRIIRTQESEPLKKKFQTLLNKTITAYETVKNTHK